MRDYLLIKYQEILLAIGTPLNNLGVTKPRSKEVYLQYYSNPKVTPWQLFSTSAAFTKILHPLSLQPSEKLLQQNSLPNMVLLCPFTLTPANQVINRHRVNKCHMNLR